MSALTPPRADLRGENQSEDSFAISSRIFKAFPVLCLLARSFRAVKGVNQPTEGCGPAYIDLGQGYYQSLRSLLDVAFET